METIRDVIAERDVYTVDASQSVKEVVDYLYAKRIGAVAVCEDGKLVGVFSERDLMYRVVHEGLDPGKVRVREVMTTNVFCVSIDERRDVAQALMLDKNFRHLVVLDEDEQLQGFVSMRELLEAELAESKSLIARLNDDYYQHDFKKPKR